MKSFQNQANEERLQKLLNDKGYEGTDWQSVQTLWKQGQDESALNASPFNMVLSKQLEDINGISSLNDLVDVMVEFGISGIGVPLGLEPTPDFKNSDFMILNIDRNGSGLGLQDRDIYFDDNMADKREAYKKYLITLTNHLKQLVDFGYLQGDTCDVYNFEERLAKSCMKKAARRVPSNVYNPHKMSELKALCPNIDWEVVLVRLGIKLNPDQFVCVTEVEFLKELNSCLSEVNLDTWKQYLAVRLLSSLGKYLDNITDQITFDFYGKVMQGQLEQKPRWKRVYYTIDSQIGQIVGKRFVEEYFPIDSKSLVLDMIDRMKQVLGERIKCLPWMGEDTKEKAMKKLGTFVVKIGFPEKWVDHSDLSLSADHYCQNVIFCSKWVNKTELAKCYKPVDKTEWHMTPQTVNAYYNPCQNEIVFPAGILQPPMFNKDASHASNFGGIGAVICHEITHGFDDQGAKFDHSGNLVDWWTEDDEKNFKECSEKLKVHFCTYEVHGMNVKGDLCLGENIADLGGLSISLEALTKMMDEKNCSSDEKRKEMKNLFYAWAVIWRNNIKIEEAKRRIIMDPHSPGHLRVNGIVKNIDHFYDLFEVNSGDDMYLDVEKRSKIW